MRNLSLFIWIVLAAIILGLVGNNHLNVAFRPKSTALEEWNLILNASLIHVLPSLNIIQRIGNNISALKELIREGLLSLLTDLIKTSNYVPF